MKELFHQHLLIRAFVTNPIKNEDVFNKWLTELVADIKMKVVCPAKSKYVEVVGNAGITGSINIETSHIAVHIWDEQTPAKIEMDVYSCSCFNLETVLNKINEMDLISYHHMMVDRNGETFKVVDQSEGLIQYLTYM